MVLTVAVHVGAVFSGSTSLRATVEGATYVVEASEDLANWQLPAAEIMPASDDARALSAPEGYELRSFRIDPTEAVAPADFLRVRVSTALRVSTAP